MGRKEEEIRGRKEMGVKEDVGKGWREKGKKRGRRKVEKSSEKR